MKKTSKMFIGVAMAALFPLLSCNDVNGGASEEARTTILYGGNGNFSDVLNPSLLPKGEAYEITKMPAMDSRVVSYKMYYGPSSVSDAYQGGYSSVKGYGSGFTDDNDILNSWFPSLEKQAKAECNYFALYFLTKSSPFDHYLILSQDNVLHAITCNIQKGDMISMDLVYETMLICDDKAGTLRKSINIDSIRIYRNPDWNCYSGVGGPKEEDVYFNIASYNKAPVANGPAPVIIADDVKEWMAEQIASKGNEKKKVSISEMYIPDRQSMPNLSATATSDGKVQFFLNGKEISVEEYKSILESIGLDDLYGKRNLSIPGEILYQDSRGWTVMITAEEIAELSKKYDNLSIEFHREAHSMPMPEND
jgi:hypothetical protein